MGLEGGYASLKEGSGFSIKEFLYSWGFPGVSAGKASACSAGDPDLIPGLRRSTGEGKGYPLQCSGLETSMDCVGHGVAKSLTQLIDFHFHTVEVARNT